MISYCKLSSAGGAANYLTAERTDARAEYYAKENVYSTWGGDGAAVAGLTPGQGVDKADLVRTLEGKIANSATGEIQELGRLKDGELEHRPGLDLTFSAPKSVSVAGLVGGDERVFAAHEAAVEKAMQHLEAQASARVRLDNKAIEYRQTGNLLYAKFQHETSRAMDPQMHTHVAVANATYDHQSEKWRSLEYNSLVRDLKTADAIYKNELANHLRTLGYETRWTKNGPEIEGVSREQIEQFSKRTAAIDKALEAQGTNREEASAALRSSIALETRDKKHHVDRGELSARWRAEAQAVGLDVDKLVQQAQERGPQRSAGRVAAVAAVEKAVKHLAEREQAFTRNEVVRDANEFSNGRAPAAEIERAIREASKSGALIDRGVDKASGREVVTTPAAIRAELQQLAQIREGAGAVQSIMSDRSAGMAIDALDAGRAHPLDQGQRAAAKLILTTPDRVVGVQGYAGAGKTTMLDVVHELAKREGYALVGLSNGAEQAAKLQRESGIKSQTVASFLGEIRRENPGLKERAVDALDQAAKQTGRAVKNYLTGHQPQPQHASPIGAALAFAGEKTKDAIVNAAAEAVGIERDIRKPAAGDKQLWIVDEAGQLSQKDWNALQTAAADRGAHLVFIGDKEQHQSVGAGAAFENAQNGGMRTAALTQIYRQQDEPGKAATQDLVAGRHADAFDRIISVPGQCYEVRHAVASLESKHAGENLAETRPQELRAARERDSKTLVDRAATIYLAQDKPTDNALLFTATNQSRVEINQAVREQMKATGQIGDKEMQIASLSDLKLTEAQKTEAWRYERGMIVQADRAYRGMRVEKGDQFVVHGRDEKTNTVLMVHRETGRPVNMNPAKRTGFTPYEVHGVGMSPGDAVRFTKNGVVEGVNNGTRGTVVAVHDKGLMVQVDGGIIDVRNDKALHLQHSYASTTYKDQGNQAAKGIYVVDTTRAGGVGTRDAYVGMTRAQNGTIVVTDDVERARHLVQRPQGTTTALGAARGIATKLLETTTEIAKETAKFGVEVVHNFAAGHKLDAFGIAAAQTVADRQDKALEKKTIEKAIEKVQGKAQGKTQDKGRENTQEQGRDRGMTMGR